MPGFKVNVKWGRESYKEVECNTDEEPMLFKAQLYELTGVLPERQKVMVKGKTLTDSWANFPIADKMTILLMGSKEEDISAPPPEKIKFVEDMNETELATALELPLGLANLGNTCYMNATIQCLKTVPVLTQSLKKYSGGVAAGGAESITAAIRDLYHAMDKGVAIPPVILLQTLHTAFPRFSERGEGGVWMQQDANELWTEVVRMMQQKLPAEEHSKYSSVIDQYFGGRLAVEMKCEEAETEEVTKSEESFLQLSCFITSEVKYMQSGLMGKLSENITKNSPSLGRDAVYTKTSKVDRLPAYLTVQMVRFFYKERGGTNAKILKDIKFPMSFDAYDLCTKRLQDRLLPMREKFKELEDLETEKKLTTKDGKDNEKIKKTGNVVPFHFEDDIGSNNSGMYELQAVLTHKGRTSSSGHYVAWVKHKDDIWLMCDDDNVNPVTSEDILKLSGGGDWHTAYVLLYGPRILELPEGEKMEPVRCEVVEAEPEKMATE